MKKKNGILTIVLIIIAVAIIAILTFGIISNHIAYKEYNSRKTLEKNIEYNMADKTIVDDNEIVVNDLSVKLIGYDYYEEGNEVYKEDSLVTTLEISKKDNTLNGIIYDYIIYDDNNNILSTSLFYQQGKNEENKYIKGFIKEKYNSFKIAEFPSHFICGENYFRYVPTEDEGTIRHEIVSVLNEKYSNPEKIFITILNLKYKDVSSGAEFKNIKNTDVSFILNF